MIGSVIPSFSPIIVNKIKLDNFLYGVGEILKNILLYLNTSYYKKKQIIPILYIKQHINSIALSYVCPTEPIDENLRIV